MDISKWRGHEIVYSSGKWYYKDTMMPTVGSVRDCGYCGKSNTEEGHDGCIGTLPDVMNACCGHGVIEQAYIQYSNGKIIGGIKAFNKIMNTTSKWE